MTVLAMTRRTVMCTGLAAVSTACTANATLAYAAPASRQLLIDDDIALPSRLSAFITAPGFPLSPTAVRLDAAGYAGLKTLFVANRELFGISSGATLFCLERIAWDHGFRLVAHNRHDAGDGQSESCRRGLLAMMRGASSQKAGAGPCLPRAYQPTAADGSLHLWVIRKPAGSREGDLA